MAVEMNWIYPVGMVILGALYFMFQKSRVPARQKYRRDVRK